MVRKFFALVAISLLSLGTLAGCGNDDAGDDGEGAAVTTTTTAASDGDPGDGGDAADEGDASGDPAGSDPSPEAIATNANVPVPDGYTLIAAEDDGDEVKVDLSYDGGPDVPGYQQQMEAEGWTVVSVEPINSFCIRATHGARYAEVAYLQTGLVLWTISGAFGSSMCARRTPIN